MKGFLPCAYDCSDEHELDEVVARVDKVDLKGADLKDVRLGPTGGDEAEPNDGRAELRGERSVCLRPGCRC